MAQHVPHHDRYSRLGGAIILIVLGVYFLLQQLKIVPGDWNWWGLLILLPGMLILFDVLSHRQQTGSRDVGRIIFAAILVVLGCVFLFNIQVNLLPNFPWGDLWPVLLILGGGALLLRRSSGA